MGLLHDLGALFLRQKGKSAHGFRVLGQGKAKAQGKIVFIHRIHPAASVLMRQGVCYSALPVAL